MTVYNAFYCLLIFEQAIGSKIWNSAVNNLDIWKSKLIISTVRISDGWILQEATPEEILQMSEDSANYLRNDTILKYDCLNDVGKQKANEYITDLSEQEKYTNK